MALVIDASVALKWQFEDEEATPGALAILGKYVAEEIELLTTTLFDYEVLSGIHVAINRKRISEDTGRKALQYITSLDIDRKNFKDLIQPTFALARKYGLSPYDCAYLSLAEAHGTDFVTGDKSLYKAVHKRLSWVTWVGDY